MTVLSEKDHEFWSANGYIASERSAVKQGGQQPSKKSTTQKDL